MKPLALIGAFAVAISTLLQMIAGAILGVPRPRLPVEVLTLPRTSFGDEALRVIFDSRHLANVKQPLLLVMGASAAQEAFRPADLQPKMPGYLVNNLALGAANMTELNQVFDLCVKSATGAILKDSLLVLGIGYPLFVPDEARWSHPDFVSPAIVASGIFISDIEREAMRCPAVCNPEHPVFKATPGWLLSAARQRLAVWLQLSPKLPVHPGDPLLTWKNWRYQPRALAKRHKPVPPVIPVNRAQTPHLQMDRLTLLRYRSVQTPHDQMDWLTHYMGPPAGILHEDQLERFKVLLGKASAAGMRVAVVDMPLPTWHRKESPFVAPYRARLRTVLAPFIAAGKVRLLDMVDAIPDDGFRDSIHPKPEDLELWNGVLAGKLNATTAE